MVFRKTLVIIIVFVLITLLLLTAMLPNGEHRFHIVDISSMNVSVVHSNGAASSTLRVAPNDVSPAGSHTSLRPTTWTTSVPSSQPIAWTTSAASSKSSVHVATSGSASTAPPNSPQGKDSKSLLMHESSEHSTRSPQSVEQKRSVLMPEIFRGQFLAGKSGPDIWSLALLSAKKNLGDGITYSSQSFLERGPRRGIPCRSGMPQADNNSLMRVYMWEDPQWSWGARVCDAIRSFSPEWVCWAATRENADVEIVHVDSRKDTDRLFLYTYGTLPAVVIQHSLKFADAKRSFFEEAWQASLLTASFQDLRSDANASGFAFHHMPWGADSTVFVTPPPTLTQGPTDAKRYPRVVIVGNHIEDESYSEVLVAAAYAGLRVRHVGNTGPSLCAECPRGKRRLRDTTTNRLCDTRPGLNYSSPCAWFDNLGRLSNSKLVQEYQSAWYIAALRKFEGFEIPAVEGLFCGARPLVFDIPTFNWYRGHAIFVSSLAGDLELFNSLVSIFRQPPKPVSEEEMAELHGKFAWQRILPSFFERIQRELSKASKQSDGSTP